MTGDTLIGRGTGRGRVRSTLAAVMAVLFLLTFAYAPWNAAFGDNPYGLYPSPLWYLAHGGFRTWSRSSSACLRVTS